MPQTRLLRESSHKQAAQVPLLAIFRPDTPDHGKGKKLKLLEIVQNNKKIEKKNCLKLEFILHPFRSQDEQTNLDKWYLVDLVDLVIFKSNAKDLTCVCEKNANQM